MIVGSLLLLPIALPSLVGQDFGRVSLAGWGSLGYAIVLTGVVTNLLYFVGIDRVGPSRAAVFGYICSRSRSSASGLRPSRLWAGSW
jgi:drug/metabolite transporter (DMT)-like permease